jgi:methylmalonyl-CoA/ethylmalonyl-CoA epimerase
VKVEKFERVLIAVKDVGKAPKLFSELLGLKFDEVWTDESQNVEYTRSPEGLEFIQTTSPDGPVARFIEQRGEGLYGVILKVSNIRSAIKELQEKGLQISTWFDQVNVNPTLPHFPFKMSWRPFLPVWTFSH